MSAAFGPQIGPEGSAGVGMARALAAGWYAELARIARSRIDLFLVTLMPAALLAVIAAMIAPGTLHDVPVVLVDRDGGPVARAIRRTIDASSLLEVSAVTPDIGAALSAMRSERALAVLVIPRHVGSADAAPVEIFYQGQILAAGSIAQTLLRAGVLLTLAEQAPRLTGRAGAAALPVAAAAPGVSVTVLGNATGSLGWYLGLLLGGAVIHLLFAVTAVGAIAAVVEDRSFVRYVAGRRRPALDLVGRLAPHALSCWLWCLAWIVGLTLLGGYRFLGSMAAVAAGMLLLSLATVGLALLITAATREAATALSAIVVTAGSALAYSGASLPIDGAPWPARVWCALLPLTHYLRFQMDALIGAHARPMLVEAGALALYPLVAGGAGLALVLKARRS